MTDGLKMIRYDELERLKEDGSNWTFWKTRMVPYLKGSRLWPYVSGTVPRHSDTKTKKLIKWEEVDAQALTTILMNIVPNVQAGLDCSSAKAAWDGLSSRYAQADPIAQNLAQTRLRTKHFMEGSTETLPAHIAELQRLREACGGLGVDVTDAQFTGVITLSMPTPSWDPVVGTLGGILDLKVVISCLITEWSRRQGLTNIGKDANVVFQTSTCPKCENCNRTGHVKAKCWDKGGSQEGQYPEWYEGKRDPRTSHMIKGVTDTPIVWTYGHDSRPDIWFADSAATVHVSPNREDFTSYQKYDQCRVIKAFGHNTIKVVGEGNILADIKFGNKITRIQLTQVMHVPGADGKILSLKMLDQKGFETRISGGRIRIMKADKTYTEASLGKELYEVKMKIILPQCNGHERRPRRPKKSEVWGANHTERPERHTTHKVSEENPITNTACDAPEIKIPKTNLEAELGEVSTRTCSREEELKRDTHQEVPQLHQSEHVATSATSAPTPDEDLQRTSASLARLDRLEEQVANLLRAVDIHQNKPELSQSAPLEAEKTQPSDTSGKEKSNITHTKHRLNLRDGMEDRADDKSGPKGNAGAHDRQSQVEEHEHEPRATEYHQEEGRFPKVDAKGHWENLVSENLQSKKYNTDSRKGGLWSRLRRRSHSHHSREHTRMSHRH